MGSLVVGAVRFVREDMASDAVCLVALVDTLALNVRNDAMRREGRQPDPKRSEEHAK